MERILFVAEAVTLAQVVRLVTLARALDPARFEIHFASASFDERVFAGTGFRRHAVRSITPRQVERAVAWGSRIYGGRTLARYVDDDLRLLDAVEPRLVVGDLRWSLLVSAPVRGVPHAALVNAYWSPHAIRDRFPLPDHPIVRVLGERIAAEHFPTALPLVFRHFARPLDRLRRAHGLAPLGGLLELLTAGDLTLYADAPELVPTARLPATHRFLGPVLWSPEVPLPGWWDALDDRPAIYVTLGSSGRVAALPAIVAALAALPVNVLVATAGRARLERVPPNVFVADYLPGHLAARRSAVVVCNGGSSTGYQALVEGRPVVGLPWNLDQYLAMTAIQAIGAGALVRGSTADPAAVRGGALAALDGSYAAGVARARAALTRLDAGERFRAVVADALGQPLPRRIAAPLGST
jgi:UDP:flavonoid glycosyltransferase YjiC (YdhE family)